MLNGRRLLGSIFLAKQKSGASDHQKKTTEKMGITRPRPDGGVTKENKN